MIIDNGHIMFESAINGGISDVTGLPTASITSWGSAIACQFTPTTVNRKGADSNGEAITEQGYSILIEDCELTGNPERLRLQDEDGNTVGDFYIVSLERLSKVGAIRIII